MIEAAAPSLELRVTIRPATAEDEALLYKLYFSVRDDLAGVFSDETARRQLLLMQFNAQQIGYEHQYPDASHDLVLLDGAPVGRRVIDRKPDGFHLVDIALLPEVRSAGIGTVVLNRLINESASAGVPLTLRVDKTNPARRLYERLGFRVEADEATHFYMKWSRPEA